MDGKLLIRKTAIEARKAGWEGVEDFNVVSYYSEATALLMMLLEITGSYELAARSKGLRSLGRKCSWSLINAMRDLDANLEDAHRAHEKGGEMYALDLTSTIGACAVVFRYDMAIGGEKLRTYSRAPKMIHAMDRLLAAIRRVDPDTSDPIVRVRSRGVAEEMFGPLARIRGRPVEHELLPLGREGAPARTRSGDALDRDERGEQGEGVVSFEREGEDDRQEEERSESEGSVPAYVADAIARVREEGWG